MKAFSAFLLIAPVFVFQPKQTQTHDIALQMGPFGFFGGSSGVSTIPNSPSTRDKQAIEAIKAAIGKPRNPSLPLIEVEFPPLEELNKLGDGSLRSANQIDDANLKFCAKLIRGLAPMPMVGPKVRLLTSSGASSNFQSKATSTVKGTALISSLKDGIPEIEKGDVCVLVSPSVSKDYQAAKQIASDGVAGALVIVNGLAKDPKSVSPLATMAYFLKPLTYNSQVVGYLVRKYPNDWTTVDLISKQILGSYTDSEILVPQTNTPDLRGPGRLVQKSVDERAIASRKN